MNALSFLPGFRKSMVASGISTIYILTLPDQVVVWRMFIGDWAKQRK